jgi:hypothetical protein
MINEVYGVVVKLSIFFSQRRCPTSRKKHIFVYWEYGSALTVSRLGPCYFQRHFPNDKTAGNESVIIKAR